ncbi:MAG TPA: hypothetical protein VEM96_00405 [Pyrinomonadaceae bacterium]|nr:hypothetical protein [Pyrinomonadaceae bacterium]
MKSLLILSLLLSSAAFSAPQPAPKWRPATLRGITVGKSKLADMVRKWGQPKWSRTSKPQAGEEERQVTWTNYERVGEFPGPTTVVSDSRTGVISRINFYPDRLTKEQTIAHFGAGYIVTRYAFDSCLDEEESEPIYESPTGQLVSVEYRARGIAIAVGNKDMVTKISYVSEPIGSTKSRCGH